VRFLCALLVLICLATAPAGAQQAASKFVPVTDQILQHPDPADWLSWRRTLDSWGYSPLNQINKANVGQLRMVWTRGMTAGFQEGTPIVYKGVMYLPNPLDVVQAIHADTGDLIWEFKRKLPEDLNKYINIMPSVNRNFAIYDKMIIDTSADDFVYALDAETGKQVWENRIVDYREDSAQETAGPIIAGGKIISGRGCEYKATPRACVITAHDGKTGKELWRTYTIPKPGEPGDETWGNIPYENRRHVGTWMVPSYDPELNLIYIGTSVTSPAPKFMLAGNDKTYLYHNSTLALNADTGKIVWYYQHVVDHWDFDHPFERYLIDTAVTPDKSEVTWINPKLKPGERRKVITGIPGKTGIVYTLDRQTGEFLWARPTTRQNVVQSIDGATGKVTVNPETTFDKPNQERFVCPTSSGGKDFQAGAYSPVSNTMFFGLQNLCGTMSPQDVAPLTTSLYALDRTIRIAPGTDKVGTIYAISVETGKTLWKYEQRAGMMSLVATGGGLIFGGDAVGHFRAWDADNGKVLWDVNLGSGVCGYPIAFAVNGKEYIAASTGVCGLAGNLQRVTPEIKPSQVNAVYVFALP